MKFSVKIFLTVIIILGICTGCTQVKNESQNELLKNEFMNMGIQENIINELKDDSNEKIVTDEEKESITNYINKICNRTMKINEFNNINEADKKWIYSHLITNDKEYGRYLTEEEIKNDLVEIFSSNLNVDVKKDTLHADGYFIPVSVGDDKYEFLPTGGMTKVDYVINEIEKEDDYYIVNLIEYSVQYDMEVENLEQNYAVFAYNDGGEKKWKKVFQINKIDKDYVSNKVLENKEEFLSYNLILESNEKTIFSINKFEKVDN